MALVCSRPTNLFISGYMMGSPTRDRAQWRGSRASEYLAGCTPGTPVDKNGKRRKSWAFTWIQATMLLHLLDTSG